MEKSISIKQCLLVAVLHARHLKVFQHSWNLWLLDKHLMVSCSIIWTISCLVGKVELIIVRILCLYFKKKMKLLGVPIADKKTEGPTRRICFLGLEIDTEEPLA